MYSKVKIGGHPLHIMLVGFPVAFYTASLVCYACYHYHLDLFWFRVAVAANAAGVATAALAALPGFIDWLNIPKEKRAKKTGLNHMICNVGALLLFGINLYLQCPKWDEAQPDESPALSLTGIGFIITLIAGFLGWTLVQNHHVGISLTEEQKNLEPMNGVQDPKN